MMRLHGTCLCMVAVFSLVVCLSAVSTEARELASVMARGATGKMAPAVAGRVLVQFQGLKSSVEMAAAHKAVGATVLRVIPHTGLHVVQCPQGLGVEQTITRYKSQKSVAFAEPDYIVRGTGFARSSATRSGQTPKMTPNDPQFDRLYGMMNISAPAAWDVHTGTAGYTTAVIDTGIDRSHEDLAANTWINTDEIAGNGLDDDQNGWIDDRFGWDFADGDNDPNADDGTGDGKDHGTHCAGTIGAVGGNGIGVAGVAWACKLMSVRVLDVNGSGSSSSVMEGVVYAADNGAHTISLSLGGGFSVAWDSSIEYACSRNCVIVCALGNDDSEITSDEYTWVSPVCNDGAGTENKVIGVAAVDSADAKCWFSNFSSYGSFCDVSAPGEDIYSTLCRSGYGYMSGTSMATPHVAGVATLLRSLYPNLSNAQIIDRVRATTDDISLVNGSYGDKLGTGRVNLYRGVSPLSAGPPAVVGFWIDDDNVGGTHGNGDGRCDPGEAVRLTVRLRNQGSAVLRAVNSIMSTTSAGVSISDNADTFGDIGGGETVGGVSGFALTIASDFTIGTAMNLVLNVMADNGGPYSVPLALPVGRDAYGEPDGSYEIAAPVATDGTISHRRFEVDGDTDWFSFEAVRGVWYTARTSNLDDNDQAGLATKRIKGANAKSADSILTLYSTDGSTVLASDDDGGGNLTSVIEWQAPQSGRYYVECTNYNGSTGTYDFAISGGAAGVDLVYVGYLVDDDSSGTSSGDGDGIPEPGETIELSVRVQNNGTDATNVTGLLTCSTAGVTITDSGEEFGDIAGGATGSTLDDFDIVLGPSVALGTGVDLTLHLSTDGGGSWRLPIVLMAGRDGYGEPDNNFSQATPVSTDSRIIARRHEVEGDEDWFRFSALPGQEYVIRTSNLRDLNLVPAAKGASKLHPMAADTVLELYDVDGETSLDYNDDGGGGLASYLRWRCPAAGAYFVKCRGYAGVTGAYDIQFSGSGSMLTTHMPASGATGVARNTPVGMVFAWAVNQNSAEQHFELSDENGNAVAGTYRWLIAESKMWFVPDSPLQKGTRYTATLTAGIAKSDGGTMDWSENWVFTTSSGPAVVSFAPVGDEVATNGAIRLTFDEAMHQASVLNNFDLEPSISGTSRWSGRTFIFTPSAPLPANSSVRVVLHAACRSTAGIRLGRNFDWTFTTVDTNTPPSAPTRVTITPNEPRDGSRLVAVAEGSTDADPADTVTYEYEWSRSRDGGNSWCCWGWVGSSVSGSETLPGERWKARARASDGDVQSEWVESQRVTIFSMLNTHMPTLDAVDVPRRTPIGMTFRWPVDQASVASHLRVEAPDGTAVAGTFKWLQANRQVHFLPSAPLRASTMYRVILTPGITRPNSTPVNWSENYWFRTTAGPTIIGNGPRGLTVATTAAIAVAFDQPMNRASAQTAFSVRPAVTGTFTWSGRRMTFRPTGGLQAGTHYDVTVGWRARSAAGLAMGRAFNWGFETAPSSRAAFVMAPAATQTSSGVAISFTLSNPANVNVIVSNLAGRQIAQVGDECAAGANTLVWNGRGTSGVAVPSGNYLLTVEVAGPTGDRQRTILPLKLGR
ncbi:MAG: Ig-like domain-containing protein [Armatimonadota bacterium]